MYNKFNKSNLKIPAFIALVLIPLGLLINQIVITTRGRFESPSFNLIVSNLQVASWFVGVFVIIICLFLNVSYYKKASIYLLIGAFFIKDILANLILFGTVSFLQNHRTLTTLYSFSLGMVSSFQFITLLLGGYTFWQIYVENIKPITVEELIKINQEKLNKSNDRSRISVIISIVLMTIISLISFGLMMISIYGLLFGNVSGGIGGARNGLEVFALLFLGIPVFIIHNFLQLGFFSFNKKTYRGLEYYPKRQKNIVQSWVIFILFTIFLNFTHYAYVDSLPIALVIGTIYALVVTLLTFYDIYLVGKSLKKHI